MTVAQYVGPDCYYAQGGALHPARLGYIMVAGVPTQIISSQRVGTGGPPPVQTGAYGGTTGWILNQDVDLTVEPPGTTYTTGVRTNTDQSYNRKANATWDANGLTITAARADANSTIYSADVMMRGISVPGTHALEFDVTLTNTGVGRGHAFWMRGLDGNGEIDLLEYMGANAGNGSSGAAGTWEMKGTLIETTGGTPYLLGQKAFATPNASNAFGPAGISYDGTYRVRVEMTDTEWSYWLNGQKVNTITKSVFENTNGAGSWANVSTGPFYPRLTLQINNGTSSTVWGFVPPDWLTSTIRLSALRIYQKA